MQETMNLEKEMETSLIQPGQFADELLEIIRDHEQVKTLDPTSVLRVEEKRSRSWSGVRGCCDQNTVDANGNAIFADFVKEKLYQYRHLRYINSGHGGGTASCRNSTGPWPDNRRTCGGYLELTCWIEFMPQS